MSCSISGFLPIRCANSGSNMKCHARNGSHLLIRKITVYLHKDNVISIHSNIECIVNIVGALHIAE